MQKFRESVSSTEMQNCGWEGRGQGSLQLILVLVGQGLGDRDGLQHVDEAHNNGQRELLSKAAHCGRRQDSSASAALLESRRHWERQAEKEGRTWEPPGHSLSGETLQRKRFYRMPLVKTYNCRNSVQVELQLVGQIRVRNSMPSPMQQQLQRQFPAV